MFMRIYVQEISRSSALDCNWALSALSGHIELQSIEKINKVSVCRITNGVALRVGMQIARALRHVKIAAAARPHLCSKLKISAKILSIQVV
ncbi:hypothetical protein AAKU67_004382 [Oxalobacteraceae bacterium GrIS 2.11]